MRDKINDSEERMSNMSDPVLQAISSISQEVGKQLNEFRTEIRQEISSVKNELSDVKTELKKEISEVKTELAAVKKNMNERFDILEKNEPQEVLAMLKHNKKAQDQDRRYVDIKISDLDRRLTTIEERIEN